MSILSQELDISGFNYPQTDLKIGRLFYKTDTKILYTYDGTTWTQVQGSGGGILERDNIIPTGSVNGVNITYTLPDQFSAGSLTVSRNGLLLQNGVDFFEQAGIPGFTMAAAPLTGSILIAFYSLTPTAVLPTKAFQSFVATAGQTIFNLNFSYTPGVGGLEVYSSGMRQLLTTDYLETNSTTVTFTSGRQNGEIIQFVSTGIQPNYAHGSTHNWVGGADPIRIPFSVGTTYPSTPLAGQPAFRTDTQAFAFYNGLTWIVTQGSGEFTRVQVPPVGLQNSVNTSFTLPETYIPGSLTVTRNGLALDNGIDFTEQPTLPGFTMVVPPASTDTLNAFYKLQATFLGNALGSLEQYYVLPTGVTDGVNITYTLPSTFVTGTLMVTRNGLVLDNGIDFFESQALPGFTMTVPPASNATLNAFYRIANGVSAPTMNKQTIVATAGQGVFNLNFSYTMNSGGLTVYSGGLIMVNGVDYTETSPTSVTFFTGRQLNENVSFVSQGVAPNFAHGSTHNIGGSDPLSMANLVMTTRVVTSSGAVQIYSTDYRVILNKSVNEISFVNLMASPFTGETIVIKDGKGNAATYPIVIQPAAGTIDGATNVILSLNYSSATLAYNGTQWGVE